MDHAVSLTLERVRHLGLSYRFRVAFVNRSSVRLLLAWPDDMGARIGLRIVHAGTGQEVEVSIACLESGPLSTVTLEPGERWSRPLSVWPCDLVDRRPWNWIAGSRDCWEMPRWSGRYLVSYEYRVDENSFDPISHARFEHLGNRAESVGATVWTGHLRSNEIAVRR
jgi:hypothetical protein